MDRKNRRSSILKPVPVNTDDDNQVQASQRPKRRVSFHTHRIVKEFVPNSDGDSMDHMPHSERMQFSGQSDLSQLTDQNFLPDKENDETHAEKSVNEQNKADNSFDIMNVFNTHVNQPEATSSTAKLVDFGDTLNFFNLISAKGKANPNPTLGTNVATAGLDDSAGTCNEKNSPKKVNFENTMGFFDLCLQRNFPNGNPVQTGEDLDKIILGYKAVGMEDEAEALLKESMNASVPATDTLEMEPKTDETEYTNIFISNTADQSSMKTLESLEETFDAKLEFSVNMDVDLSKHENSRTYVESRHCETAVVNETKDSSSSSFFRTPTKSLSIFVNDAVNEKMHRLSDTLMQAKENRRRSDVLKAAGKTESPLVVKDITATVLNTPNSKMNATYSKSLPMGKDESRTLTSNLSAVDDPTNMFNDSIMAAAKNNSTFNVANTTRLDDVATPLPMFEPTLNESTESVASNQSALSNQFNQQLSLAAVSDETTTPITFYDPDVTGATTRIATTEIKPSNIFDEFNLDELDIYCDALITGKLTLNSIQFESLVDVSAAGDFTKNFTMMTPTKKSHQRVSEPTLSMSMEIGDEAGRFDSANEVKGDAQVVADNKVDVPADVADIKNQSTMDFNAIDSFSVHTAVNATEVIPPIVDTPKNDATSDVIASSATAEPIPVAEADDGTYTLSPKHSVLQQLDQSAASTKTSTPTRRSFPSLEPLNQSIAENLSNSIAFSTMIYSFSSYGFADRHLTADESVRLTKFSEEIAGLKKLAEPLQSRWPDMVQIINEIVPELSIYEFPIKFKNINFYIEAACCDVFLEATTISKELTVNLSLVKQKYKQASDARKNLMIPMQATFSYVAYLEAAKNFCTEMLLVDQRDRFIEYVDRMKWVNRTDTRAKTLYEQRLREMRQEAEAEVSQFQAKLDELRKTKKELYNLLSDAVSNV